MQIKNILHELGQHPAATFLQLLPFNQNQIGAVSITGVSPVWEMHPDTDEFFYILEGKVLFILLEDEGEQQYVADAGSAFVVPKGIWHKPGAPEGAKFMFYTPGVSLHSEMTDPRQGKDG